MDGLAGRLVDWLGLGVVEGPCPVHALNEGRILDSTWTLTYEFVSLRQDNGNSLGYATGYRLHAVNAVCGLWCEGMGELVAGVWGGGVRRSHGSLWEGWSLWSLGLASHFLLHKQSHGPAWL